MADAETDDQLRPLAPAPTRGRLVIADQVVVSVARLAAREVTGTVSDEPSGLGRKGSPRARATVAGDRARIAVEVHAEWPHPLARVTADVRAMVATRVTQLTGLHVDSVDVTVSEVVVQSAPVPVRSVG